MSIEIVPFTSEYTAAVRDFNSRLEKGGSSWRFFRHPQPVWISKRPGHTVWREYFLAVDGRRQVRGAYCLKPQDFLVGGTRRRVASWQPLSEAIVDSRHSAVALHATRRRPPACTPGGYDLRTNALEQEAVRCYSTLREGHLEVDHI